MPRIAPLAESEWPERLRGVLDSRPPGVGSRLGDNNIFSTLARHEDLFRAWLPFGGFLLGGGVLPARERELLILRTGYNCGSAYEWGQHVHIAEALGIDREEILRVAAGPQAEGWSEAEAALLRTRSRSSSTRDSTGSLRDSGARAGAGSGERHSRAPSSSRVRARSQAFVLRVVGRTAFELVQLEPPSELLRG